MLGIIVITTEKQQKSNILYFHFSYLYLFFGGKQNCLHAKSMSKWDKNFINHNIKVKMPTVAEKKQLFHPSLPSWDAPFQSFDRKWTDLIRQSWT